MTASDGTATLSGNVGTYLQKTHADTVAKRVYGVCAVVNDIALKIPSRYRCSDGDIAAAVRNILSWDTQVDEKQITAQVKDGWAGRMGRSGCFSSRESADGYPLRLFASRQVT